MKNIVITGVIILQLFVTATVFAADKTKTTAKCHMDSTSRGGPSSIKQLRAMVG
jgi:hypothetical protein